MLGTKTLRLSSLVIALVITQQPWALGNLVSRIDHAPCVRLFHATGDVGCRSPSAGGIIAPLFSVEDESHIRELEELASAATEGSREDLKQGVSIVIQEDLFNSSVLERLSSTGLVGGVLVLEGDVVSNSGERPGKSNILSPDVVTPQGDSTPTSSYTVDPSYRWNPEGEGLIMRSLPHPLVLVTGESTDDIKSRATENRRRGVLLASGFPRHQAKMNFYFGQSIEGLSSRDCLTWVDLAGNQNPQCLPIGGQSAWAAAGPAGEGGRESVFVVAGMDSTAVFHGRAAGANSAASGLVALLCAAGAIGQAGREGTLDAGSLPKQMVFAAFQAEAWGFTGSRRFVEDAFGSGVECHHLLEAGDAPGGLPMCLDPLYQSLQFQQLGRPSHVLAVDQVGFLPESELYLHPSPAVVGGEDMSVLKALGIGLGQGGITVDIASVNELPPTPLTAFVKANASQSGFVIAGYDNEFVDMNYHSHRDTRQNVNVSSVAAAALLLARSAVVLAGGEQDVAETLEVNTTLVETLLDCIAENWACDAMREYVEGELTNMQKYLGFKLVVEAASQPSLYAGPLEFRVGGGLPSVRQVGDDGSWRLHANWQGDFDPDHLKVWGKVDNKCVPLLK